LKPRQSGLFFGDIPAPAGTLATVRKLPIPPQAKSVDTSRALNEEQADFLEKLVILERQAAMLADDLPPGMNRTRAEHIATTLKLLKARFDLLGPVILAPTNPPGYRS
jgi:hypothetical protein